MEALQAEDGQVARGRMPGDLLSWGRTAEDFDIDEERAQLLQWIRDQREAGASQPPPID